MHRVVLSFVAFLASAACAQPPAKAEAAPGAPKLVIAISIDQLSADLFDQYRPHFTGGLARLSRGTVFRNGYQGHAATETCPGHSTILTGSRPSRTGIIANAWYDLKQVRSDKSVYCAEDERVPGSSTTSFTVSPYHLRVRTLGELMKAKWPASRSVAVAGKDRSAVMTGGQRIDQRWYPQGAKFVTDLKVRTPVSVERANAAVAKAIAEARPPLEPPPICAAKSRRIAIEGREQPVGDGRFARAAGDARGFRASPEFDGAVLALAAGLIEEMKLGQGRAPDILSVGLAATDYVGHSYGSGGQEMCLQLLSLDRDLGDFFALLDRWELDYAVVLTADHGVQDIPERLREQGVPQAARVTRDLAASEIGKAIAARLNLKGPVLVGGFFGDIYIDPALRAADRTRVLNEALVIYRAHPQVEATFSAAELERTPSPTATPDRWTLIERARASFDPDRSGDIVVLLRRYITPVPASETRSYVATHGSPWDYDRRVPILFWRRTMSHSEREQPIETADIMPTLAAMLGITVQAGSIDGKCLLGVQGANCPPR